MKIKPGLDHYIKAVSQSELDLIKRQVDDALKIAPLFIARMPKTGYPSSVKISSMGELGWVSDQRGGYRYQKLHPETNKKWPAIPDNIIGIWHKFISVDIDPNSALINYYQLDSKMGLHLDNDESDLKYPILSISIGASALFGFAGIERTDPKSTLVLNHGDILIMADESRLIYHGIDKIYKNSGFDHRINITLRRA